MTKFINPELKSESKSESGSDIELELKSESGRTHNCNVFTHSNFILNHRSLFTGF